MSCCDTGFGFIIIDHHRYDHDVVVLPDKTVVPRPKHISERKRHQYGHVPLTEEEFREITKNVDADVVIIGTGQYGALPVEEGVKEIARQLGVELIVKPTPQALEDYVELRDKKKVLAIFHVTC